MQLIQSRTVRDDRGRVWIIVHHFPSSDRCSEIPPYATVVVYLIEVSSTRGDADGSWIVVQQLPSGVWHTRVPVDLPVGMKLVEIRSFSGESNSGSSTVNHLPIEGRAEVPIETSISLIEEIEIVSAACHYGSQSGACGQLSSETTQGAIERRSGTGSATAALLSHRRWIRILMSTDVEDGQSRLAVKACTKRIDSSLSCFPREDLSQTGERSNRRTGATESAQHCDAHCVVVGARKMGANHVVAPGASFIDDPVWGNQIVVADVTPTVVERMERPDCPDPGIVVGDRSIGRVMNDQMAHGCVCRRPSGSLAVGTSPLSACSNRWSDV